MKIARCINIPTYMLAMVVYNKGSKTASDIKKTLNITYPAVLDINKSLMELNWIFKKPINKKSIEIVLTEKGKNIAGAIDVMFEKIGIILKEDEKCIK